MEIDNFFKLPIPCLLISYIWSGEITRRATGACIQETNLIKHYIVSLFIRTYKTLKMCLLTNHLNGKEIKLCNMHALYNQTTCLKKMFLSVCLIQFKTLANRKHFWIDFKIQDTASWWYSRTLFSKSCQCVGLVWT